MMRRRTARASGFTLVELIVGMGVMTAVLAGAYASLEAVFKARKAAETRMDVLQGARTALSLITAELRAATVLSEDFEFVGMDRMLRGKEADNVDFATRGHRPQAPGEGDFSEMSWYVDTNPATGETGLWRRRDPSPDDEPLAGGTREEILTGVETFRLEYYDGFTWYDEWGNASGDRDRAVSAFLAPNLFGIPDAVRITLACRAPSGREDQRREPGTASEKTGEPSIWLQTVVRLNLAGRAFSSSASSSSTSPTSATQPTGGR